MSDNTTGEAVGSSALLADALERIESLSQQHKMDSIMHGKRNPRMAAYCRGKAEAYHFALRLVRQALSANEKLRHGAPAETEGMKP